MKSLRSGIFAICDLHFQTVTDASIRSILLGFDVHYRRALMHFCFNIPSQLLAKFCIPCGIYGVINESN